MDSKKTLPVIQLDKPCRLPWSDLAGDDRTRFCSQCRLYVHNLSAMTSEEAAQFLANRSGRTCVAFAPSASGTPITLDYAPRSSSRAGRTVAASLAVAAAATAIAIAHVSAPSHSPPPSVVGMLPLPASQPTTQPATDRWSGLLLGEIAPANQCATQPAEPESQKQAPTLMGKIAAPHPAPAPAILPSIDDDSNS